MKKCKKLVKKMPNEQQESGERVSGGAIGSIEKFIPETDQDFEDYLERMGHFFELNNITEDKRKKSAFITLAGPICLKKLKAAIQPALVSSKTYKEITEVLKNMFAPKRSVMAERFKFYDRRQKEDENISEFVAELQILAQNCKFDSFLQSALRDKLVCGLRDKRIQARLLDHDRDFDESFKLALSMELAQKNVELMQPSTSTIGRVGQRSYRDNRGFRNRQQNYRRDEKNSSDKVKKSTRKRSKSPIKCFKCGEWSYHIAADCPAGKRSKREREVKLIESEHSSTESEEDLEKQVHAMRLGALLKESSLAGQSDKRGTVSSTETVSTKKSKNATISSIETDDPEYIECVVSQTKLIMEIDCGACISILHYEDYLKKFSSLKLKPYRVSVKVVTGEPVEIVGKIHVSVQVNYKNGAQKIFKKLPLVVVHSVKKFVPLCGRNWLTSIFPDWRVGFQHKNILPIGAIQMSVTNNSSSVIDEYKEVFNGADNSPIRVFSANIVLKENATPIFHKPYTIAFGLREEVHNELMRLVREGILIPVKFSRWASPLVCVKKKNGKLRLCVDCKSTINQFVTLEHHPLPRVDECFLPLKGCIEFCKIDLAGAYQQVLVAPESRELLTINTPWGLFQYTRLIFGLNSSPAIFQSIMEQILQGIPQVTCYLDDILIGGKDKEDCERILKRVLERLREYNVKANLSKCVFFQTELEYLGHIICKDGVKPVKFKLEVIRNAKTPTNLTELKSYIGLLTYYGRFIENLSIKLEPFYELLRKDVPFVWTETHARVFRESKTWLTEESLLTHYSSDLPLVISVDASGVGVGAVLSHVINGKEYPVPFASSTLSPAEKNYSIVDREALSLVFAVKTFHKYIYGRSVTVYTDHACLRELFGKLNRHNAIATARVARWAILLGMYDLKIIYKKGKLNSNADFLSRFPDNIATNVSDNCLNFIEIAGELPISEQIIREHSASDELIQKVIRCVKLGFPKVCEDRLKPFQRVRHGLSVSNNILYVEHRIVIPESLRNRVLKLLHSGHEGVVRVKSVARGCCWWPKIDQDIEVTVRFCETCQRWADKPGKKNLTS